MNADPDLSARDELVEFISSHFSSSLGADPFCVDETPMMMTAQLTPLSVGFIWSLIYILLLSIFPFLFASIFPNMVPYPPKDLVLLTLWGGFYLAFACTTARVTSSAIFHTIKTSVVPNLPVTAVAKITKELRKNYGGRKPYLWAYCSAAIAVVISGIAIYYVLS